jgi:ferredoxin
MSYMIVSSKCNGCGACEFECPNRAITAKGAVFVINPGKCTECKGIYPEPQCAAACPSPKTCIPT